MATQLGITKINEGRVTRLWFEVDVFQESIELTPNTSASIVEDDKNITRYTTASTGERVALVPTLSYGLENDQIDYVYVSDNPTKIGVDAAGNVVFHVEPAETASATITITATQGSATCVRTVDVTLTVSGSSSIDVIESGVVGSARKAFSDTVDDALVGANVLTDQDIFDTQDHSTPSYTRNTDLFLSGSVGALTCISPWNSSGGTRKAGVAITKRHVALAAHYKYDIGTTVRFIAADNTVVDRTVVQGKTLVYDGKTTDIHIVLLDSDLPASITPCKIFPSNFEDYLPAGMLTSAAKDIPFIATDFEEKLLVLDATWIGNVAQNGYALPTATGREPTKSDRNDFYEAIIVGDSGNPMFAAIGSEIWLVTTFYSAGGGNWYGGLISELNAMIVTLDTLEADLTGYTVTEGDLSSYTNYS